MIYYIRIEVEKNRIGFCYQEEKKKRKIGFVRREEEQEEIPSSAKFPKNSVEVS